MPNLTIPGCNWLGPGNSLEAPPPTCYADQLAKEHDFEYDRAKRAGDIRRADRKAIFGFAADAITNGSPAALVGAVGISAKYAVESLTGVLYPPSLNKFIKKQGLSIKEIRAEHRRLDAEQDEGKGQNNPAKSLNQLKQYHQDCENKRDEEERRPRGSRQANEQWKKSGGTGSLGGPGISGGNPAEKSVSSQPCSSFEEEYSFKQFSSKGKHQPYRAPIGYKERPLWMGPECTGEESWFNRPEKVRNHTPSARRVVPASCGRASCPSREPSTDSERSWATVTDDKDLLNLIIDWDKPHQGDIPVKGTVLGKPAKPISEKMAPPVVQRRSKIDPLRMKMIEAVCDLGNEDKIKRWAKARETQSVMMMGTSDPTDREGEEKSEREALDESEGGDDMVREARTPVGAAGGVVPREQRKEKTKLRPRKKAGPGEKLGGTKLLNMENMEEELIFFKQAWDMWGTNPNNIGQRPFVQATDKLGELINNLIRPLMKGYIDLAQEVKYLRGVSSGIGRLSDSLESIDAGVRELQGRDSSARTEYVEESISGNRHIAVAMIKLEEIIREEIGKVVTRVDAVDEKTNKIGGKVDRLIREDITALGRKVDVVSRFVKEGSIPATKVAFAPNTNTAVLASKSNTVGAGSKTKRPRENQEDDSEHENDQWQVVRGRKVPRQKSPPSDMESGRSTAPYSSQFSATDTEGQDSSLTAASGRRRRQTRKQRDRLKRYEGILQKTKELKEKGSPPAILVQKTRPVSLQSEMEITEGAETNDGYKQALMSPPSLKRAVREAVNPVEMQLNVKRVQPLGMDKLKLTVGTEQQAVLLRGELANKGFTVQKDMGPNKPLLMKVHRVDQEIPKENVADKAYDQNAWISECFTREAWKKEFVPSFAKGKREYDNVIWVCAVSARRVAQPSKGHGGHG
ncbi:hypothetical protein GE061_009476 [Apolygus lucorum]|uniref:Phospholipase A2-like domain-containing protein n=1 Tax=Apolygus lucorum TaxID=248454 RepID=A0A8S9Y0M6_APOLU|nr:hypothetical protein GE061_009476 [Apolygus lucorum]